MKVMFIVIFLLTLFSCEKNKISENIKSNNSNLAIASTEASEPSFLEDIYLDKNLSFLTNKFKESLKEEACGKFDLTKCKENNLSCKCYSVKLAFTQYYNEDLYFVIASDKVMLALKKFTADPSQYFRLNSARNIFQQNNPNEIYQYDYAEYGYRGAQIVWKLNKGFASSHLACEVSTDEKIVGKIQDCKVRMILASRLQQFKKPEGQTLSQLKY